MSSIVLWFCWGGYCLLMGIAVGYYFGLERNKTRGEMDE